MLLKVIRPKTGFKPVWFHWTGFKPVCENGLAKDFGDCAFESDLPKNCFQTSLEKKLVPKQFLNWFQTSFWNQVGKGLRGLCFWKWLGPKLVSNQFGKKTGSKTVLKLVSNQFLKPGWQRTSGIVLLKVIWQNWSKLVANQFTNRLASAFEHHFSSSNPELNYSMLRKS